MRKSWPIAWATRTLPTSIASTKASSAFHRCVMCNGCGKRRPAARVDGRDRQAHLKRSPDILPRFTRTSSTREGRALSTPAPADRAVVEKHARGPAQTFFLLHSFPDLQSMIGLVHLEINSTAGWTVCNRDPNVSCIHLNLSGPLVVDRGKARHLPVHSQVQPAPLSLSSESALPGKAASDRE